MARLVNATASVGLFLFALGGCDRKPSSSDSNATTTAAGKPASSEGWRSDGERFEPLGLYAVGTEGETSWRITVARQPTDCAAIRAAYPEHTRAAGSLDLWFARPLGTDGAPEAWGVRGGFVTASSGGRGLVARGAMVEDVTEAGGTVRANGVELALQEHGQDGHLFQFEGELRAENCGRVARSEPKREQPKLTLRIANRTVVIQGASVRPEGGRRYLRLTRAPHRCDSAFTEGFDFYVDLALEGDPPKLALVALLGDVYPESATGSKGKDTFVVRASNWSEPKGDLRIELEGSLDAGGYAVSIHGEVNALRCTPAAR